MTPVSALWGHGGAGAGLADALSPGQVPPQGSPLGFVPLVGQSCSQSGSSAVPAPEMTTGEGFLDRSGGPHRASAGLFPQ